MSRRRLPAIQRVLAHCTYEARGYETPCLIFSGAKDSRGYGMITIPNPSTKYGHSTARTHVVTYEFFRGPIPDGLELDHLCRQTDCCDDRHLEAVTHQENVRRGRVGEVTKARMAAVTHCPQGHEYTPENTYVGRQDQGRYSSRKCRTCRREWMRTYHDLKRVTA